MRILLVASYTINMMPYVSTYTYILNKLGINYDVIQWDRFKNHKLIQDGNIYTFGEICYLGGSKINKIIPYINFRENIVHLIKKNNYNKIIVFNTLPAIFIVDYLIFKFKNRFVFDYRDYSYEKYGLYKKIVNYIVSSSYATVVSSKGFYRFIHEDNNVFTTHNISNIDCESDIHINLNKNNICIGFVGLIRYDEENKMLISKLMNSSRYKLLYIGKKYVESSIEEYCLNLSISNVEFMGEFKNEDKPKIYEKIDIINALYGNESFEVTTALPNKLYDCLLFKKPILVSSNTYLAEVVEKYNLGISVDKDDDILKKLNEYIENFNREVFMSGISSFLEVVKDDMNKNNKMIEDFILD